MRSLLIFCICLLQGEGILAKPKPLIPGGLRSRTATTSTLTSSSLVRSRTAATSIASGTGSSSTTGTGVYTNQTTTFPTLTYSSASLTVSVSANSSTSTPINGCGAVAQYYGQTAQDWQNNNLDSWLSSWIGQYASSISSNSDGFAGAFGNWAIGNPDFSCRDDGSTSDCDFNPCANPTLNSLGPQTRQAYYVMESLNRLHSYFMGLRQSFTVSGIAAALSKDEWATVFYKDKDDVQVTALREIFTVLTTVVGIGASFASIAGTGASVAAGAASAIFSGATGAVGPLLSQHQDDTFLKSADLGAILGQIVVGSVESFTAANNVLMHGDQYQGSGDIRNYVKGGQFVAYPGIDKNAVTNVFNSFLLGQAINSLYRVQKIFILGGGACGDNQGIGNGPQQASICRDGKAWYLYYWQENDVISTTAHQWGWMAAPPGSDKLNSGVYAGVTIQAIISASLDAYNVAGYSYTNATAASRAEQAIQQGWANPGSIGPSWEGTFTIPVCDVSGAINSDYQGKEYILQPYDHESRPVWCGPICSGSIQQTQNFIAAANMVNFQSPIHLCQDTPPNEQWWPEQQGAYPPGS